MYGYFASTYVCVPCTHLVLGRPEECILSPGTEVIDMCESPCGSWESNLHPLKTGSVLTDESSLQAQNSPCFKQHAAVTSSTTYKIHPFPSRRILH